MRANVAAALAENPEPDGERPALVDIEDRLLRPRPGTRGCRVGRMTQDPQVVEDPELLGIVREAFDTMAQRWTDLTSSAIQGGELPADLDARELADALAAVIQGGYVLSRARGSQEPMDSALRGMVALLESAARSRRSEPPTAHSEHPHKEQS
ncbi:MAG: hypothetical protein L0H81_07360, partial [Actinomyces sp.]|nr:hypothetical protein [Actinomyces sp.]